MYLLNTDRAVLSPLTLNIDFSTTENLTHLFANENVSSIAFQSVLVAAIQIVERVREEEVAVARAAISLAHKEQLSHMLASTDSMMQVLRSALNDQGSRILDLQPRELGLDDRHNSWWFCLAKAIETLNAGMDWINSIVSGQQRDSPSRKLANIVSGFLEQHHSHLDDEIHRQDS